MAYGVAYGVAWCMAWRMAWRLVYADEVQLTLRQRARDAASEACGLNPEGETRPRNNVRMEPVRAAGWLTVCCTVPQAGSQTASQSGGQSGRQPAPRRGQLSP